MTIAEGLFDCMFFTPCCLIFLLEIFLETQKKHGPSDGIASALAAAYHDLGFQTLANQVRRSVRSVRGNQWMFRIGHPADQPLRIRPELLHRGTDETFPVLIAALAAGKGPGGVPGLVWRQRDGQFLPSPGVPIEVDLHRLPLPRRDLVLRYRPEYFFLYFQPDTSVATGRGCPFRCNFCSVAEFYRGRTSQMCPERVVAEVSAVQTDHISFVDDNFLMGHRRAREIARQIEAAGIRHRYSMQCRSDSIVRHPEVMEQWARIGLHGVLLGLEGANDTMLASVNKKSTAKANDEAIRILQANGIIVWGAFIIDPDWTADDFKLLEDYVAVNNITHTQFTVLTPLPGTDLYRERRDQLLTADYTCFDALHAVLPTKLPREEFYRHFAGLYGKPNIQANYDLVSEGRISLAEFKRGHRIRKSLSQWEKYTENDPILRGRLGVVPAGVVPAPQGDNATLGNLV